MNETNQNILTLQPQTIKLDTKGTFGKKLDQLGTKGAVLVAAIGVHTKANQAQVTVLSDEMIEEARAHGIAKRYVKFDENYRYYGQVAIEQDEQGIAALSAEDNIEQSPAFTEVSREIAKHLKDGTRMARRQGPSKLFVTELDRGASRHVRSLDMSSKTQLASRFVGDKIVTTTGQGAMRYYDSKAARGMLRGEQVDKAKAKWLNIETPEFARADTTLGRSKRERSLLGLKDGRIAIVDFKNGGDKIQAEYHDAIDGGKGIDGTIIGFLPEHNDLVVSVKTDQKRGSIVTLSRVSDLPPQAQQILKG